MMPPTASGTHAHIDYLPRKDARSLRLLRHAGLFALGTGMLVLAGYGVPRALARVELKLLVRRCASYVADSQAADACAVPECWSRLYEKLSPPGSAADGVVFLHERISPAGNRRLVAVELYRGAGSGPVISSRLVSLGLARGPREVASSHETCILEGDAAVAAGQASRIDPSHFTFEVRTRAATVVYDGWLTDDDRVLIERRD